MIDRRLLLGLAAAGSALGAGAASAAPVTPAHAEIMLGGRRVRFADLTHKLTRAFNFGQNPPRLAFEPIAGSGKAAGMLLNRIDLVEHTGTHIDAPRHFASDGASLGELPIQDLIVPLAILDLRTRAVTDPNLSVGPKDIDDWERRYGRLPDGCCVALWSGYDPLTGYATSRPQADVRRPSVPGFGPEVLDKLSRQRKVRGVAVDSMSIDSAGHIPQYPFHKAWLSSGHWAIEGLTNLAAAPAHGAVLIVGAPPIEDATGMPIRALAMF